MEYRITYIVTTDEEDSARVLEAAHHVAGYFDMRDLNPRDDLTTVEPVENGRDGAS